MKGLNYFWVQTITFTCNASVPPLPTSLSRWSLLEWTLVIFSSPLMAPCLSTYKSTPPNLQWTWAHNTYVQDTHSQGLRPLKGLCQGSGWVRKQDASWIVILSWNTKGALNMYVLIFCRNIRHSLKACIYFWKKVNIRLTMKTGWKACIRQKHKLMFGMRWNTCWPDSLYKILHFRKIGRKVKKSHLIVSWSIPLAASSYDQGKGSNSALTFCFAHHLFWQAPYVTFRVQLFFLSPRAVLYF